MLKKLIVIKNKQLDLLCDEIGPDEKQLRVTSKFLELVVTKISTSSSTLDIQIAATDPTHSVTVPADELLRQTLDLNPSAKDVCIQVSFMSSNPVSGYETPSQFTTPNGVYV